jgi:Tfp pilus assembly protein PilX
MMSTTPQRGFTLLIAVILATVSLAVGLALADIAYKQVLLSSTARNSQVAFYRADSALECALYYDQQIGAFTSGVNYTGSYICEGLSVSVSNTALADGGRKYTFTVPCSGGGTSAVVTIYKQVSASCNSTSPLNPKNCFFSSGFNTCNASSPIRFERGVKALY